jgi:deoxyribonuclease V
VRIDQLHSWQISITEAQQIQQQLAAKISKQNSTVNPRRIAGFDISAPDAHGIARAAAVVLSYPEFEVIELRTAEGRLNFPYVPGFLSFRETPMVLSACQKLSTDVDLILVDGQGIAHPRRFGIASHIGLLLDTPTIGCAKSRLCGTHAPLAAEAGARAELVDRGDIIGMVVRTKAGVNPVYISIGHKIDLQTAVQWVLRCCRGQRLPEPARLAHMAASGKLLATPHGKNRVALGKQAGESHNRHCE